MPCGSFGGDPQYVPVHGIDFGRAFVPKKRKHHVLMPGLPRRDPLVLLLVLSKLPRKVRIVLQYDADPAKQGRVLPQQARDWPLPCFPPHDRYRYRRGRQFLLVQRRMLRQRHPGGDTRLQRLSLRRLLLVR